MDVAIGEHLVKRLIAAQFPQWAKLSVRMPSSDGLRSALAT
jgi:hypothetical protein